MMTFSDGGAGGRKRILVVDDSLIMRNLIKEIVDSDPDLEVVDTAPDGRVALQKVRQLKPDAVLLDIEMPEMSGLETQRLDPFCGILAGRQRGFRKTDRGA